jgi:hypothetical protein
MISLLEAEISRESGIRVFHKNKFMSTRSVEEGDGHFERAQIVGS